MIKISKNEMMYLVEQGFHFHSDIVKTYSGNHRYYACERPSVLKALKKYNRMIGNSKEE